MNIFYLSTVRSLLFFYGIFAAIGGLAGCAMLVTLYSTMQKINSWEESTGIISGFSDNPIIQFDYYGEPHEFTSSYSSSDMQGGDAVTVHFPTGQPEEAEIKDFFTLWFFPLFTSVFAFVFGGIGFYGVINQLKRVRAKRDLFTYGRGRKTSLPVTSIIHDSSFKVNGRSPYVILCQYHDPVSNNMFEFKSDYVWYDPAPLLKDRREIDIYVDPNDLKYYYMDTSFLPAKA
jgi:hypothetical protein